MRLETPAEEERADCWPDPEPVETEPPFDQVSLTKLEKMREGGQLCIATEPQ